MSESIQTNLLDKETYKKNFNCNMHESLNIKTAKIEANRCYFCHDAPCVDACPTDIDVPLFIKKISTENIRGAAKDILSENIMGGTCSRVCPVESLCEKACVRNTAEDKPVTIGGLQQFATDTFFKNDKTIIFERASETGKKIAVIGAGPAGLSCAHKLSLLGNDVTIFEAKEKSGGLNEFGIAAYKMTDDFAQQEVDFILSLGGIKVEYNKRLGENLKLKELQEKFDSVFLSFGLGNVNQLGLENENLENVIDAIDYIAKLRQATDYSKLPVGRDVVVIGGGSTAVDIAVQSKRLGAENVTLVYRRGTENMNATSVEQAFAQKNNVLIKTWAKPSSINTVNNKLSEITFEYTESHNEKLKGKDKYFTLKADVIFKAIGQNLKAINELNSIELKNGKISVDKSYQTNLKGIYAGGDCIGENDLTVYAVKHGKLAAQAIHNSLMGVK